MKILVLSNCRIDPNTGSGQTRLAWSEGLRRCGHDVRVRDTARLQIGGEGSRLREVRIALGAVPLVLGSGADLIECYGAEFGLAMHLARRWKKRAIVVHHSDGNEFAVGEAMGEGSASRGVWRHFYWGLLGRWRQWAFRDPDALVCATNYDRNFAAARGWPSSGRIAVVPLGLRDAFVRDEAMPPRECLFVFAGSWTARKGADDVVRAGSEVLRRHPLARLAILGCGVPEERVASQFPQDIRSRVEVFAAVTESQMAGYLRRATVALFASLYEGFGLALAEAMACGCACVTTPTGLGGELEADCAVIVRVGDWQGMADVVLGLLAEPARAERMGRRAQERAKAFRWERSVDALEMFYRELQGALRPQP